MNLSINSISENKAANFSSLLYNNEEYADFGEEVHAKARKLGINFLLHFGVREFYPDGTTVGLSSNEIWNRLVNNQSIVPEMERHYFNELISVRTQGVRYIIRTRDRANNSFLKHLVNFDMANSLILYRQEPDIIKGYYFIIHQFDSDAIRFFINNLSLFEKLIDQISPILQKSRYFQNALKNPLKLFSVSNASKIFTTSSNKHSTNIDSKVVFKDVGYTFTPTETVILELTGIGCTSKEIARQLKVSYRTIEWHLKNIKVKLGKTNKIDIIEFVRQAIISYKQKDRNNGQCT